MAILPILHYPNPVLAQKAEPVTVFDEALAKLAKDMAETMYAAPGIGLAAPQIGRLIQMAVVDVSDEKNDLKILVNPKIEVLGPETVCGEEGCLSLPDVYEKVERPAHIRVTAQDIQGQSFTLECNDLLAICIQHECDHLKGVVFIDHLSLLKKTRAAMKLAKKQREKLRAKKKEKAEAG